MNARVIICLCALALKNGDQSRVLEGSQTQYPVKGEISPCLANKEQNKLL